MRRGGPGWGTGRKGPAPGPTQRKARRLWSSWNSVSHKAGSRSADAYRVCFSQAWHIHPSCPGCPQDPKVASVGCQGPHRQGLAHSVLWFRETSHLHTQGRRSSQKKIKEASQCNQGAQTPPLSKRCLSPEQSRWPMRQHALSTEEMWHAWVPGLPRKTLPTVGRQQ